MLAAIVVGLAALVAAAAIAARAMRGRDREAAERQWAELARLQADTAVRVDTMRDTLAGRQAELERALNERLEFGDASSQLLHDHVASAYR